MRKFLFATALVAMMLHGMQASGKLRCTPVYIFGVSASFNDSIVYFTDIQVLDSAWIDDKTNFLMNRSDYSIQLRDHLSALGNGTRTCLVSFATKEKDILKKYAKMRAKLTKTKKKQSTKVFDFREIDSEEFKFQALVPSDLSEAVTETSKKAAKRAAKSKEKIAKGGIKETKKRSAGTEDSDTPPSMPPRR